MKIFTHIPYNRWDKYRKRKVQISKKFEFTEKFCEFINLIINSVQDIWLKSQNFVGFEQCNRKWNSSSIIPELQTGQNLSMWGVWLYLPEFQSWDRNLHKSFLLVKMMSTRYTLTIPRDRYLVDVYRIAVKLSRNSRNKIKWYRPWNNSLKLRSFLLALRQQTKRSRHLLKRSYCENLIPREMANHFSLFLGYRHDCQVYI